MKRLIAALAFVVVGCASFANYAGWTHSSNETTCEQWTGEMTQPQRLAMTQLVLGTYRIADIRSSEVVELAPAFLEAITQTCSTDTIKERDLHNITRVGFYVYRSDAGKAFRP